MYLILLLSASLSVQAEIYRSVDEEGNVHYSDQPQADAELVPTPTPNAITMPKPKAADKAALEQPPAKPVGAYTLFTIVSPANAETLRSNSGDISVALAIEPALDAANGHRIIVYLDGQPVISTASVTEANILLANVGRGEHTIRAEVRDANGIPVISSPAHTVHMKRLSSQHKKPAGTPPGPTDTEGNPYTPGPQGTRFIPGPVPPTTP